MTTFKVRGQGNGANAVKSPISQGIGFRVSRQYTPQYNYSPVSNKICPKVKFTMPTLLFSYSTNGYWGSKDLINKFLICY